MSTKDNLDQKKAEEQENTGKPEQNEEQKQASEEQEGAEADNSEDGNDNKTEEGDEGKAGGPVTELEAQLTESKDKYLRLYSDFENFRKRTNKEKQDFQKYANESLITDLLPVLDDFERAQKNLDDENSEVKTAKEGFALIYNKLMKALKSKGLEKMDDARGKEFDMEKHEAITKIPAPSDELKGKIVDVVEDGYYLKDKVIRFAKVVIGE